MPSSKASNWKFDVFGKALRKIDKSPWIFLPQWMLPMRIKYHTTGYYTIKFNPGTVGKID
jgi:hypothetical protein